MKRLLITLILVSPFSFADLGDVYLCETTSTTLIHLDGKKIDEVRELSGKFRFRLDEAQGTMVYKGIMTNDEKIRDVFLGHGYIGSEFWIADGKYSMTVFDKGKYLNVRITTSASWTTTADCDKF